jgi:hypothetical protein
MISFCRVAMIVCLLSLAQVPAARGQSSADDFTGLWAYQTSFPVGLAGELTIERRGALARLNRRRDSRGEWEWKRRPLGLSE